MATYVNDLRLTELATGEGSGTWGVTTNTNLELIGEALGYGTQDCFATDADATTTVADGASDPARAMYFKVTSSATLTATRTLTIAPNTMTRVMLIENATTGSQSIAISQGSGGNVTIANGAVKMVYLDGAGAGAAVVDALADLELGTITVANLTATTADINGGTIDGATLGGSSQVTITDADMNGGTIDGVVIGAATPAAGSFTTITGSDDLNIDSGTFFVDASANAVGIGTTSPSSKLHILGGGTTTTALFETAGNNTVTISRVSPATLPGSASLSVTSYGRLGISSDDYMTFATGLDGVGVTERMRIDSSGDLLVGKTTSDVSVNGFETGDNGYTKITRSSGTANVNTVLMLNRLSTDGDILEFRKNGNTVGSIGSSVGAEILYMNGGSAGGIGVAKNANILYPVDSNGALSNGVEDIGAASYRFKDLYLSGAVTAGSVTAGSMGLSGSNATNFEPLFLTNTSTTASTPSVDLIFRLSQSGGTLKYAATISAFKDNTWGSNASTDSGLKFSLVNANTTFEAMRIDSSGNLLVGQTSTTVNTNGAFIGAPGSLSKFSRNGGSTTATLVVNKQTNDGVITAFQKDGTTVGSISTESGDLNIGTGDTGLQFADGIDAIRPFNITTNVDRDGTISLGISYTRFKDLYLSGGVYLGGTVAANQLDDYEEGTFTPTATGATTAGTTVYTAQYGWYTKIGQQVNITLFVQWSSLTGTGALNISGLPFTSKNDGNFYAVGAVVCSALNWAANTSVAALQIPNSNNVRIYISGDDALASEQQCVNENADVRVTLTYYV